MNMTLFCDASLCHRTGAGGWGAWVIRNDWPRGRTFGAMFNQRFKGTGEAELAAIATAAEICHREKYFDGVSVLMVQSDSLHALSMVAGFVPGATISDCEDGAPVVRPKPTTQRSTRDACSLMKLAGIAAETGLVVTVRHVRGRQWVNTQCDTEARKHMQRARDQAETEMRL